MLQGAFASVVVLVAVLVGMSTAIDMRVLVLVVLDGRLAVVVTRSVRVNVRGSVGVGVLVLSVLLRHGVLQKNESRDRGM